MMKAIHILLTLVFVAVCSGVGLDYRWNAEAIRNTSSTTSYWSSTSARLGIGTTTPSVPFEVNGDIKAASMTITSTVVISGAVITPSLTVTGTMTATAGSVVATNATLTEIGSEKIKVRVGSAGLSVGSTAGTTMVYFKNDGKLGVGTTSPANTLDVAGSIRSTTFVTSTTAYADRIQARSASGLQLYEDGGAGIFVKDGGSVGVGTATPVTKLHVFGGELTLDAGQTINFNGAASSGTQPYVYFNASDNRLIVANGVAGSGIRNIAKGSIDFWTNSNARMTILTAGNVGIGTASPSSPTGRDTVLEISDPTGMPGIVLGTGGVYSNKQWEILLGDDTAKTGFNINDGTNNRFKIDASGNVGIGTATPSAALSVASTSIQIVTSSSYTALQACAKGSIAYDEEYLYVCSTAGMKRVTLGASW